MSEEPRPRIRTRASSSGSNRLDPGRSVSALPEAAKPTPLLDYRLVILTNGRSCLRETIEAFRLRVTPSPAEVLIFDDGGTSKVYEQMTAWHSRPVVTVSSQPSLGFCGAVNATWKLATEPGPEFVFWLEDDIEVRQRVDLEPLGETLRTNPKIAQMALMRNAVNSEEIAAGGCFELRREQYEDKGGWLESRTNFSTTCSLMRREFMLDQPWPEVAANGEGIYSIGLLAKGYRFGVWGGGEPWVKHIGARSGHGY